MPNAFSSLVLSKSMCQWNCAVHLSTHLVHVVQVSNAKCVSSYCSRSISFQVIHPYWLLSTKLNAEHHPLPPIWAVNKMKKQITNNRRTTIHKHTHTNIHKLTQFHAHWHSQWRSLSELSQQITDCKIWQETRTQSTIFFPYINLYFTTYLLIIAHSKHFVCFTKQTNMSAIRFIFDVCS